MPAQRDQELETSEIVLAALRPVLIDADRATSTRDGEGGGFSAENGPQEPERFQDLLLEAPCPDDMCLRI